MKKLFKFIVVAAAGIALLAVAIGTLSSRSGGFGLPPMDERPWRVEDRIKFTIGTTAFDIPAVYYKSSGKNYRHKLVVVNLWALLPDFEWYDRDSNHYEFVERLGKGRRLRVTLRARESHFTTQDYVTTKSKKARRDGLGPVLEPGKGIDAAYELEIFPDSPLDQKYIYWEGSRARFIMRCVRDGIAPHPGCKGWWDFSDDVVAHISFHKKYLPQWKHIWRKAKRLLEGETPFEGTTEGRAQ